MAKKITGNNQYLKELNKAIILDLIRKNKRLSRKELADLTGLSPTACGSITRELIKEGFLHETGQGESTGGRKPVMLELKPNSYFAVGFDIGMTELKMVIADITANILVQKSFEYGRGITADEVVKLIGEKFYETVAGEKLDVDRFIGCGLSIPGILERKTNKVVIAPNLSWSEVDLDSKISKILNLPVYIENEAMCSAICEHWIGKCSNVENFVCINIESGIGAGIFIGESVYRGYSGSAGEIGHLIVKENGRQCGCGNRGCLETYASVRHMLEEINDKIQHGYSSEVIRPGTGALTWERVIDAAYKGDELCIEVLNKGAKYVGCAVAFLINTLNPEAIVLGKCFADYAPLVMDTLIGTVNEKALKYPLSKVKILTSEFGMNSSALGAAMIPIRKVFGK
ncbi:ROK family transcriptional regulator [Thermoclostridium stercorarium]|uniref:ROK family transcriptional regulator n=1 Tax=Thermoclostridium stercorarium TaxID=1510 RepID=UPI002249712D|nr:ROK family transcriptional regulator [Thermoclostridium stercorarium]UZQ86457.1 ROK family transcriptional regulator [Thermoclostridium stercorarium]